MLNPLVKFHGSVSLFIVSFIVNSQLSPAPAQHMYPVLYIKVFFVQLSPSGYCVKTDLELFHAMLLHSFTYTLLPFCTFLLS